MNEKDTAKEKTPLQQAGEDLFNFAIDREDVKWLTSSVPEEGAVKRSVVEYELQILKIITVGWYIVYYLENSPHKTRLSEIYWQAIHEFSEGLSTATGLMIGQDINYFQILKERLDMYVKTLDQDSSSPEPAQVIGPAFARQCGNAEDLFAFMAGSKMFVTTVDRVKRYIAAADLGPAG